MVRLISPRASSVWGWQFFELQNPCNCWRVVSTIVPGSENMWQPSSSNTNWTPHLMRFASCDNTWCRFSHMTWAKPTTNIAHVSPIYPQEYSPLFTLHDIYQTFNAENRLRTHNAQIHTHRFNLVSVGTCFDPQITNYNAITCSTLHTAQWAELYSTDKQASVWKENTMLLLTLGGSRWLGGS